MAHTRRAFLGGTLFPTLWRTMVYYLERADEIHFIGYGFPDTDLTLLLEFTRHREKVRTIVIYDGQAQFRRRRSRLRRLFPHTRIINNDALEWIAEQVL
jgi:hypothetical protein